LTGGGEQRRSSLKRRRPKGGFITKKTPESTRRFISFAERKEKTINTCRQPISPPDGFTLSGIGSPIPEIHPLRKGGEKSVRELVSELAS